MTVKSNQARIYSALTRPTSSYGVPVEALVGCVVFPGLVMIVADSIFYLGLAIPSFFACREIVKRDPNAFKIIAAFLKTSATCRNRKFWGGSSLSPVRTKRSYSRDSINFDNYEHPFFPEDARKNFLLFNVDRDDQNE